MADNKEYITTVEEQGSVNISEDVIVTIAHAAVMEVEGVSGFASKMGQSKGMKIHVGDDKIVVDAYILLEYGVVINDVARAVQNSVLSAIESMTGIVVSAVNVHICGVAFEKGK